MSRFSLLVRRKRVTLSARIELNSDRTRHGEFLRRGQYKENFSFEKVESTARDVITKELPFDMVELFGLNVKTKVVGVRDGSVILFFEVLLAGYGIVSDYSGFFDSIELIKSQCERLLFSRLKTEFAEDFEIDMETVYPPLQQPAEREFGRWMRDWPHHMMKYRHGDEFPSTFVDKQRDGLFWFFLIFSIVLLVIIGFLVYGAVIKTYFAG
jgi:hypothetical protein